MEQKFNRSQWIQEIKWIKKTKTVCSTTCNNHHLHLMAQLLGWAPPKEPGTTFCSALDMLVAWYKVYNEEHALHKKDLQRKTSDS